MQYKYFVAEWDIKTFVFYLSIIFISYILLSLVPNYKVSIHGWNSKSRKKYPLGIIIVCIMLMIVKGLCIGARDVRTGYYYNFISATSFNNYRDSSVEIGYRLLMIIIRNIFGINGYPVFLIITALFTVFPIIYIINKYKTTISAPFAILLYTSVFYYPGFSLNRMYLAASIGLLAFDAMIERKEWKSFFLILIASSFHITSMILFIPFFLILFKKIGRKMAATSLISMVAVIYFGRKSFFSLIGSTSRYAIYGYAESVHIGLEQFIYYIPFGILIFLCHRKRKEIKKEYEYPFVVITLTGFAFGIIGYIVPIFGRIQALFIPLILVGGYYSKLLMNKKSRRIILKTLAFSYCIARFYIYISQYYNLDDMMPYISFLK